VTTTLRAASLFLVMAAATAGAGALQPGDHEIGLEEWREMTDGRTVWYSLNGQHWGREYFHPGGSSATFISADGECVTAPWAYADGIFCFSYSGMDCFRHIRRDGPLSCEPPLSS
jgi:hypothetical protein